MSDAVEAFALETRLAAVDARILSLPLDSPIETAYYRIPTIEMVVLRVRDADGAEGVATLWCFGVSQAKVLVAMLDYLAPFALAGGPGPITAVMDALRLKINFFGFKGVSVFGLSAFDMALHDLLCRRRGLSLSALLGRRRESVPTYWSGLFPHQAAPELFDETQEMGERGFRAFKLRIGQPTLSEDIERIEAVRSAMPAGSTLMLDALQSWTREEAMHATERLADCGALWLEDPLVHLDYAGMRDVVEHSTIPIATGENEYLRDGFDQILHTGAKYLLADLQRIGGLAEWQAVADAGQHRGAVLTPHAYPQIGLQLCAALNQDEVWHEYLPWWNPLTADDLVIVDGNAVVPDRPGLGLDLDAERVEQLAIGPWTLLRGDS
jgi:L-alanine-DL-glutamate epimerase-like enolase superfamily enzyme